MGGDPVQGVQSGFDLSGEDLLDGGDQVLGDELGVRGRGSGGVMRGQGVE